jgi:formamidopyrimidine-DNA glycosylase
MPELPEVETTCRGIAPYLCGARIDEAVLRNPDLRWPVPASMPKTLKKRVIHSVTRRAKYILVEVEGGGHLMIHLGMSGSLRLVPCKTPPDKHDHFDLVLNTGYVLRYRDPRRFGSIHWYTHSPGHHPLLRGLGPEPLSPVFNADYLYDKSRHRIQAVKSFIMDSRIVAGVGNIYANEALFDSGIRPGVRAGRLSRDRCIDLAGSIKRVLDAAITMGGTTLRDFVGGDGSPGYFQQSLNVYGRSNLPCRVCRQIIQVKVIGQRASYYCRSCQH